MWQLPSRSSSTGMIYSTPACSMHLGTSSRIRTRVMVQQSQRFGCTARKKWAVVIMFPQRDPGADEAYDFLREDFCDGGVAVLAAVGCGVHALAAGIASPVRGLLVLASNIMCSRRWMLSAA